jgi:putative permease
MLTVFKGWMDRYFSDEEALILLLMLICSLLVILLLGGVLTPLFASIVFAYLLHGLQDRLEERGMPHIAAVFLMFLAFFGISTAIIFIVFPAVWHQLVLLFNELPSMVAKGQTLLMALPERYPAVFTEIQIQNWIVAAQNEVGQIGQVIVSFSVSRLPNVMALIIYLVLVPILVFFFLKDGRQMVVWFSSILPVKRPLMNRVSKEMDEQISNYVRGKVVEIFIAGVVTYIAFAILDLNYAALLAILVGLSVVIPYIGAAVVTVPVAIIAYFQWGGGTDFFYLMMAYGIIQALDGNVLVPLLFSEAVNLHPVAIILAVLVFGGMWGLWGVFFAIPLATLAKAVVTAWPRREKIMEETV